MSRHFYLTGCLTAFLLLAFASFSLAQTARVAGRIVGTGGQGLAGATAVIKGTTQGSGANAEGLFSIENVPAGRYSLIISFVGYKTQELAIAVPGSENVRVVLAEDATSLNDVVVTGVFDERKKISASVAISTLDAKTIERLSPTNGLELLRQVPGVFVNTSLGEVRTQISTRGIANRPNFQYDQSGVYYVSLQEDGLPVSNINFGGFSHDLFYRTDATLKRLEAVRGGTAAITGANAPGGIFNYLSKTGGAAFGGEIRAKVGLEGDGRNPFYRTDLNFGGPLGIGGLTYNLGGFYRRADGPFYMGYPMNVGGQVKLNVEKRYAGGSVTFYGKYLNDRNASPTPLIGHDFDHPQLVDGIKNTDSFALPADANLPDYRLPDGTTRPFTPKNLSRAREYAAGINWRHSFGNTFSFSNNVKYSDKDYESNNTAASNPNSLTSLVPNALIGLVPGIGVITYRDLQTRQVLATVQETLPAMRPPTFTVLSNNLPGQDILQNGFLFHQATYAHPHIQELLDQLVLSAKTEKMTFNLGMFVGVSDVGRFTTGTSGVAFTTLENRPRLLDISFVNALAGGKTQQITSPEGFSVVGGAFGVPDYTFNKRTLAPFFAQTWQLSEKLTFDYGLRFENTVSKGTNYIRSANNGKDGGLDGNPLTVYDNAYYRDPVALDFNFTTNTLSYSGALNYLISPNQSIYARFSEGKKAPEMNLYQTIDAPGKAALIDPAVQSITQIEVGYKYQADRLTLAATPFYSRLGNILQAFQTLDNNNVLYNLQPFFNTTETEGIELEATAGVLKNLSLRGVATFQASKLVQYKSASAGPTNSRDDDTVLDYSGNQADNTPHVILNFTPTYSVGKLYAFLSYQYTGDRYANTPNTFILRGYSQLDFGAGYTFGNHLQLTLNANNLANSAGVVGWGAPGGFPAVFNKSDFTPAIRDASPNALFPINIIQPRAYFLTAVYGF